jgi:hypothetical protein
MDAIPDEKKMCHRTGFTKGCRELCLSGACQDRWVGAEVHDKTKDTKFFKWACVDDLAHYVSYGIESRLLGIQAAVEARGNDTIKMIGESILRQDHQHREALALSGIDSQIAPPQPLKLIAAEPN